jgi:hypothetical protein
MEAQAVVALVLGTVVALFVPALVWKIVIGGLIQIVREKGSGDASPRRAVPTANKGGR